MFRIEGTENEINRECPDGSTPLHIAVSTNNLLNVLILIREGSQVNAKNHLGVFLIFKIHLYICVQNCIMMKLLKLFYFQGQIQIL